MGVVGVDLTWLEIQRGEQGTEDRETLPCGGCGRTVTGSPEVRSLPGPVGLGCCASAGEPACPGGPTRRSLAGVGRRVGGPSVLTVLRSGGRGRWGRLSCPRALPGCTPAPGSPRPSSPSPVPPLLALASSAPLLAPPGLPSGPHWGDHLPRAGPSILSHRDRTCHPACAPTPPRSCSLRLRSRGGGAGSSLRTAGTVAQALSTPSVTPDPPQPRGPVGGGGR